MGSKFPLKLANAYVVAKDMFTTKIIIITWIIFFKESSSILTNTTLTL